MSPFEAPRLRRSVQELIARGNKTLKKAGVLNPRLDTDLLLCASMGLTKEELYCVLTQRVDDKAEKEFTDMLSLRERRCPVSYILGEREFWSLSFHVDPGVLIPRQETELVVETALQYGEPGMLILDVGTGSGCIAIALASELLESEVWASDTSSEAIIIARENVARHGLEERVHVVKSDLLPPEPEEYDMIVSNPPYVSEQMWEDLMPEVRGFEPREALIPGPTGLELYPRLVEAAADRLAPQGALILEIGIDQADEVSRIIGLQGFEIEQIVEDYGSIPRVIAARKLRE
ncbi:peptide chain release factor N(5)-glutamine methyltransferase [Acidobacteriota bacterium]